MSTEQVRDVVPEQDNAPPERVVVGLDSLQDTIARLAKTFESAPRRRATDLPPKRYTSKFEYLVEQNLISQQDLDSAIAEAKRASTHVDLILMQQYNVSKAQIGQSSSVFYRVPFIEFDDRIVVPPDLLREVKVEYLKKNYWVPLKREAGAVVVLVDDPHDLAKVDSVERALKNQKVKLAVGFRSDILRFIAIASGEQAPRAGSTSRSRTSSGPSGRRTTAPQTPTTSPRSMRTTARSCACPGRSSSPPTTRGRPTSTSSPTVRRRTPSSASASTDPARST